MSSRKAQIKINGFKIIHYIYGKISNEEEELIEDLLFENDDYAMAMDELLSFVIRHDVKQEKLQQIFKNHHVVDLEDLVREVKNIIFQPSFYQPPLESFDLKSSSRLNIVVSVKWQTLFKPRWDLGKIQWKGLLHIVIISFVLLNVDNINLLTTSSSVSASQSVQLLAEYPADNTLGLKLIESLI